jgi:glycosyltransferase involved in cell wall biosynthesis
VVSGEHAIVAPLEEFPAAIARLLRDGPLRATLRSRGRRLAEERYDWSEIADAMHGVVESALAKLPGPPSAPQPQSS